MVFGRRFTLTPTPSSHKGPTTPATTNTSGLLTNNSLHLPNHLKSIHPSVALELKLVNPQPGAEKQGHKRSETDCFTLSSRKMLFKSKLVYYSSPFVTVTHQDCGTAYELWTFWMPADTTFCTFLDCWHPHISFEIYGTSVYKEATFSEFQQNLRGLYPFLRECTYVPAQKLDIVIQYMQDRAPLLCILIMQQLKLKIVTPSNLIESSKHGAPSLMSTCAKSPQS